MAIVESTPRRLVLKSGATTLGTFPLDNTPQAGTPGFDVTGKATVDFVLPQNTPEGPLTLTLGAPAFSGGAG